MHSSLVRVQNVFGFFTSVAFVVAALVALSTVLFPNDLSSVNVDITNFKLYVGTSPEIWDTAAMEKELMIVRFQIKRARPTVPCHQTPRVRVH